MDFFLLWLYCVCTWLRHDFFILFFFLEWQLCESICMSSLEYFFSCAFYASCLSSKELYSLGFEFLIKQIFYYYTFQAVPFRDNSKSGEDFFIIKYEQFCSQQRKLEKISNIVFFSNKFRGTMKLSIIITKTLWCSMHFIILYLFHHILSIHFLSILDLYNIAICNS
jgi:hypothetical protein